jgi:hypothetical protein
LSGVLFFEADVAEPFEHAQFFEDLLRDQRRHEREEFPPAAVRGELQETDTRVPRQGAQEPSPKSHS